MKHTTRRYSSVSRQLALALALGLGFALAAGCNNKPSPRGDAAASSSGAPVGVRNPSLGRIAQLHRAEDTRSVSAVTEADIADADPSVRRAAVRALARAQQGGARDKLLAALADRDPEVVAWAAYGLGEICRWDRDRTARRIITRAVAFNAEPAAPGGRLDPWFAFALALGKCGNEQAEKTLVSWLSGPKSRSIAAAKGLGGVVMRHKRMSEETAAALLRATRGDAANDPFAEALYAFGRLKRAPVRVENQLMQSCRSRLGHDVPARVFVLRALATLDADAVDLLGSVLTADVGYSAAERAEAARALSKIDTKDAQDQLVQAIDKLAPRNDPIVLTTLVGPGFGSLTTALSAIRVWGSRRIRSRGIDALLELEPPPSAPKPIVRRIGLLRCGAARLVSGRHYRHADLVACDPEGGAVGDLAQLSVIDRGKLTGARATAWKSFLDSKHPLVVREAAIRLLANHPEAEQASPIVAKALRDEAPGVVAEAASLVFKHSERFFVEGKGDTKTAQAPIAEALREASKRAWSSDAIESVGAVARACGKMRLNDTRDWLNQLCASPNPTLRANATQALRSFSGARASCEPHADNLYKPAKELGDLADRARRIELDTDVGKLTLELDPSLAPVAVTRVLSLIRDKFYDGMPVHRVVPGFVVQFGDKNGDGYGGAGQPPLRCETSPVPFDKGVVGMALGGRDTGSSQLFVTLGPAPHLDGQYAVIGKSSGPWDALAEGDVIRTARVVE